MKTKNILTIALVSLLSAVAAIGLFKLFGGDKVTYNLSPENGGFETVSYTESQKENYAPFDFTNAASKGLPAVVHIRSTVERNRADNGRQAAPQSMEDFWDQFFGNPRSQNPRGELPPAVGYGSGVVISPDGYIVTNNHVIEDASEIKVTFFDSETLNAELVGTDPTTDIALVKVEESDLPYLKFADSDKSKVGQWVAAIGNPAVGGDAYALTSTVTAGIISAIGRNIGIIRQTEELAIESFIQTDAVINKGNSGGALVNEQGDLIGINSAISTPTGVYAGYGFAVPSNIVKKVVTDLKDYGEVRRALLGVTYQDIETVTSRGGDVNTEETEGLLIVEVKAGSAADKAGLEEGDVIVAVDDRPVTGGRQNRLQEIIGIKRPGEEVDVKFKRKGNARTVTVELLSAEETSDNYKVEKNVTYFEDLGLQLEELSEEQRKKMDTENGVRVSNIDRNGVLYQRSYGDITVGFIITSINGIGVENIAEAKNALKQTKSNAVRIEGFNENDPTGKYVYTFPID